MADIFLHNPQNKLSKELVASFDDSIDVLDYSDELVVMQYPNITQLPCFVLPYPEHQITQTVLDSDDNEIQEVITIPSGYYQFFMLNETIQIDEDGAKISSYTKKDLQEYLSWKSVKEEDWS